MKICWDVDDDSSALETVLIGEFREKESADSINHEYGFEGVGREFFDRTQKVASSTINKDVNFAKLISNSLNSVLDGLLIPDITWTAKDIVIGGLFFESLNGFVNVLDFAADDVDSGAVEEELFGDFVADASSTTGN